MIESPITVLIVDDDAIVRSAVASYVGTASDLQLLGTCSGGEEALRFLSRHAVDVVIMDISMPGMGGVSATAAITRQHPTTKVLLLTSLDDDQSVREGFRAGAGGFLLKDTSPESLVGAIRSVHRGAGVVSPGPLTRLVASPERPRATDGPLQVDLSPREQEVLGLLCAGMSNAEIAGALFLSESTVKTYVSAIMAKFDVNSRLKVVVRGHELGLVERA